MMQISADKHCSKLHTPSKMFCIFRAVPKGIRRCAAKGVNVSVIFNVTDPLAVQTGLLVGLRHEAVRLCQVTEGRPAQGAICFEMRTHAPVKKAGNAR